MKTPDKTRAGMVCSKLLQYSFFMALLLATGTAHANPIYSGSDTLKADTLVKPDKVDNFNAKAEKLFKIIPVPLYSYSTEAGHIFGLAKYNLIRLDKRDTISQPSKIAEVMTFSTEGRINISVSTDLIWHENKYLITGYINYKRQPEYILGIGNDVSIDDVEEVQFDRIKFVNNFMISFAKHLYTGIGFDISDYTQIKLDSASFIIEDDVPGQEPSTNTGAGLNLMYDSRDNRYNAYKGYFARMSLFYFPSFLGNTYEYTKFDIDLRTYINPWLKHVIALQVTTSAAFGEVPFYDLSLLGGEDKMRGYYKGALRDKVLVDGQIEYRMPVWKMLGITTFIGTGRVAPSYDELSLDGFWLSYGLGLRLRVDTKNNTNLRFDWGFGPGGINAFYINFAEAF
jgi:outer membrane protein assembly factor BamA